MTTFGYEQSLGYDRRATRLLTGLYRRIATDIDAHTPDSATVLDLGTGPGKLLSHVATRRPDLRLHGVDLSPHMIEIARRTLAGQPIDLAVADVAELPHPHDSIDFAVSSLSMHEWPDLPAAVTELRRVLRPGGGAAIFDFRFTRTREIRRALSTEFGSVDTETVRLPWHPVAVITCYRVTA
ncbi:class I SAM-dependent methyltransferase [Nocardia sp. NPDC057272]|uniref:class I SAM-dependent methyltransferase n=1 Tax=Nocardia sp. NPDC057272 TaxID=3346079 RepID=UPI00362BFF86